MEIILGIIFLLICCVIAFLVTYWLPILLGILTAIIITAVIYSIYDKARKKKISRVVKARIISREPITRREKEVTGYTTNRYYYPYWYSEYYRYVDVIVGYRVKFSVEYKDGTRDIIACIEGDYTYNKLSAIPNRWDMGKFIDPIKRIPAAQNKAPGRVVIGYADGTSKVFEFDDEP